ncbi:HIT family protein [Cocleimonas sp. KMM 6892]|uniref:HIT family protein n=1 Tax=unclassified Cocleimonas TaxID=2639732 RepID=UPI002DB76ECD|nr:MULTISPECIES: HIT family protein [unclassified Cocleimonas]MEB8430765.1 HIT family protein [Cocleimonas sp. KMM 6892]MEC4714463.1 HIT family protein [Cocleimonas sp. KMM 6895]MEC4743796.1 HIT family protein [Cocleimonas sp. KMM 6896]
MTEENAFDPNNPCLFCHPKAEEIIAETEHALLITDTYPVSVGHCLVIPKRHIKTYFECTEEENRDFRELILKGKQYAEAQNIDNSGSPDGYNIGCNNELAAGQSVFHLHIHIIPRYTGDVENPKGGVRWVIPKNSQYQAKNKTK